MELDVAHVESDVFKISILTKTTFEAKYQIYHETCCLSKVMTSFEGNIWKGTFLKTCLERQVSKDMFRKTCFERHVSKDRFRKTGFERQVSKDMFPKTGFQRHVSKDKLRKKAPKSMMNPLLLFFVVQGMAHPPSLFSCDGAAMSPKVLSNTNFTQPNG